MLTAALAVGVVGALAAGATASPGSGGKAAAGSPGISSAPLAGTWKLLPKAPVTKLPTFTTSVWTGSKMIIHATYVGLRGRTFAYRPSASKWTELAPGPKSITAQGSDVAVWTGSEMLVIGLTSAAYNPAANTWRPIARPPGPPSPVLGWTGRQVIMWEGTCCGGTSHDVLAYNVATNTWRHLPAAPIARRVGAMGAWTGKELVVAGGWAVHGVFRSGAAYNPAANTWRRLPLMPGPRAGGTALWDGREVLFLGGVRSGNALPALRGMAYNPRTNTWRRLPAMEFHRAGFAAVWTGRHVLVWGGLSGYTPGAVIPSHGESYNPATNVWRALPKAPLHGRIVATAVWTGHAMAVWGGWVPLKTRTQTFLDGAMFQPRWP